MCFFRFLGFYTFSAIVCYIGDIQYKTTLSVILIRQTPFYNNTCYLWFWLLCKISGVMVSSVSSKDLIQCSSICSHSLAFVGSLFLSIAPSFSVFTVDINQRCLKREMTRPFPRGEENEGSKEEQSLSTWTDSCFTQTSTRVWTSQPDRAKHYNKGLTHTEAHRLKYY